MASRSTDHQPAAPVSPRQHWRAWLIAVRKWQRRWDALRAQPLPPLPAGLEALRILAVFWQTYHNAERTLLTERPAFPEVCQGMRCEARTRRGTPCQRLDIDSLGGRCKLHGGASTGPRSIEGKLRSAQNGRRRRPPPAPR